MQLGTSSRLEAPGVTIFPTKRGTNHTIESDDMKHILMVCMGNICRSPMAEAVARKLAADANLSQHWTFDSAGTHARPPGERPDPRTVASLSRRGYDAGRTRSRKVTPSDFQKFDLILAMDLGNLAELKRLCPAAHIGKLNLFLEFCSESEETRGAEVPDPYYGNFEGFEKVLDLCVAGAKGLVTQLSASETK